MSAEISVAMCTYNGSRFLRPQLDSIAAQHRLPDELVICDDSSSDGSFEIAQEFSRKAPFAVRVTRNQKNLGSTKNFENAIATCKGGIIALADQDDIWYPHKLQRIESLLNAPSAPVAVFSDADLIDGDSKPVGQRLWKSFLFSPGQQRKFAAGDALSVLAKHPVVTGATLAFRRDLIEFLLPIPANQVHDTWIAFLLAASGDILPIAEPLVQYRRHEQQQIGPGQAGFRARVEQARRTGPSFYLKEIEDYRQLAERVQMHKSTLRFANRALEEITRKISHREHRAHLHRSALERIPGIVREVFNGGYWRYSEGWQSIAKDMAGLFADPRSSDASALQKL